jgi:hypothetical protein
MGRARPSPTKPRPPRATRSRPSRMTLEGFGTYVGGGVVVKEIRARLNQNDKQNYKDSHHNNSQHYFFGCSLSWAPC